MNAGTTSLMDLKVLLIVISVMAVILHYLRLISMHRTEVPHIRAVNC